MLTASHAENTRLREIPSDDDVTRASRQFASLVQRRSWAGFSGSALLAAIGAWTFFGLSRPGNMAPGLLGLLVMPVASVWLAHKHRARYGAVQPAKRSVLLVIAGIVSVTFFMTLVSRSTHVVPSPILLAYALAFAAPVFLSDFRVSFHWLVPVAGSVWMAYLGLIGPAWLFHDGIETMVLGLTGAFATGVDAILTERAFRAAKRLVHTGASDVE